MHIFFFFQFDVSQRETFSRPGNNCCCWRSPSLGSSEDQESPSTGIHHSQVKLCCSSLHTTAIPHHSSCNPTDFFPLQLLFLSQWALASLQLRGFYPRLRPSCASSVTPYVRTGWNEGRDGFSRGGQKQKHHLL